jgi:23S rRNA (guanine745-N1)-methyltransferase
LVDLFPADPLVLACGNGHRFDVNRRGYVSLITGSRRLIGDSPAMLDARQTFLEHGWYAQLRDTLSGVLASEGARSVIDIGCGTGYYLRGALEALSSRPAAPDDAAASWPHALAVDLSAPAVARTVRAAGAVAGTSTAGLVADVWSPLPVRDGVADAVINVFAPRNPSEFHRILRPEGLLVVVIPHQNHLAELRADGLALGVHENKSADLIAGLAGYFALEATHDLADVLSLSPTDVKALIGMGPSAHHAPAAGTDETAPGTADATRPVTVAFHVLCFRRIGT